MSIEITAYEIPRYWSDNGKKADRFRREYVEVMVQNMGELEKYREVIKAKHNVNYVFLKYKQK